jgi:phage terminase small subunit|nr:MAG TPA: Terminase small subunit [Caudoviricetes sp.]
MAGMKYKDIAEKYGTTINTVKSWKKRYAWNREGAPKEKRVCTQNKKGAQVEKIQIDDGTKETLQNTDLTSEQQMFCIYYSRTFNAAQSYQKAYGCQYTTAVAHGYKLLSNVVVRAEIERLKEIKRQQIVASADDIVELQMRIAFADIGIYMSFGRENVSVMGAFGPVKDPETGEYMKKEVNAIRLNESDMVDTQIIQEVKQGRDGVSIKLADKQKAFDWLTKYFLMHPESKYRAEYEKRKAEKEGGETAEYESDGFMEALQSDVKDTFKEDDSVET